VRYDIILKSGTVIEAWGENIEKIVEMMICHDLIIIQENSYPNMVTYILSEDVSHYRFPANMEGVAEPVR